MVGQLLARSPDNEALRSENEQLRTQLESALQRLAQAEAQGSTDAGDALTQLRQDGDPKKLGAFLDRQLAKQQTEVVDLLRERAAVAYISGEIARAEQCLQQILALLPDDLDATLQSGNIYNLRGDLDAASRQYRRVLDLAPANQIAKAAALGNLGLIAQTRGQLDEARRLWTEARDLFAKVGMKPEEEKVQGWLDGLARE